MESIFIHIRLNGVVVHQFQVEDLAEGATLVAQWFAGNFGYEGAYTISMVSESDMPAFICKKWFSRIGLGFHPDNKSADYSPDMSATECADYDSDMETLFSIGGDPYGAAIEAMEELGLIKN